MKIRPTCKVHNYSRLYDYFQRKSAHAAADPWNGRSALDAAELFTTGINFMREHVKPSVRMHYVYKMEAKFLM
jgi:metal-dependent amidase/aminoacylase/carboxypeptidase family protein